MKKWVKEVVDLLEKGEAVVLATILSKKGSAPRTVGAKMIVRSDGTTIGSIGGGLAEHEAISMAAEVFKSGLPRVVVCEMAGAKAESTDMICGGSLETLLEPIAANSSNVDIYGRLLNVLKEGRKCFLVSDLGRKDKAMENISRSLLMDDGSYLGTCAFPSAWVQRIISESAGERLPILIEIAEHRVLVEPSFVSGTVYLFGAGHVGQAVGEFAAFTDFRSIVMDDREEYANRQRFGKADEIRVLDSFDQAFEGLEIDGDSYIVIVTRGHRHDLTVLRQALKTEAGYIGMIGSRRKRDTLYQTLLSEGFTRDDFSRVKSPIGIDIGADTPAEIAVSIIAELIQARAERNGQ